MNTDSFIVRPPNTLSQIIITPLGTTKRGAVAVANVTVDDTITIAGVTIREKADGGLYVRMPMKKTTDGTYIDVAHPFNKEVRQAFNDKLIDMYETGQFTYIDNATSNMKYSPKVKIANCYKYKNPNSSVIARADLVVSSFVVHNVKLRTTESGELAMNMPAYLSSTGEYRSIVVPKSKNAYQLLNKAYISEYKTDYMYEKLSDANIVQLKQAGINFQFTKSETAENLVKFKAADAIRVMAALNKQPISAPKIIG